MRLLPLHGIAVGSLLWFTFTAVSLAQVPFAIEVVDSQTGRGVPLVEVIDGGGVGHWTDNNGIVAFDNPALMNQDVAFDFSSYGYTPSSQTLHPVHGGTGVVQLNRTNRAERLYRTTGANRYHHSVAVGRPVPIANPISHANVEGQDSVQVVEHNGRLHWFWGDTLYEIGFGNFRTAGAVSDLPDSGGLDPNQGVELDYFELNGSAREMFPLPDPGPVWIDGLFEAQPPTGIPRMLTHFVRVKSFLPVFELYEQGLAIYSDSTNRWQRLRDYPLDAPITPAGHSFVHSIDGEEYIYFAEDYPNIRVRNNWDDVVDITQWEAFTPFEENTRYDAANPPLDLDNQGNVIYGWKKNTDPLRSNILEELAQNGHIARDDSPFRMKDFETGENVRLHRASVYWNDFRQNWIMIGTESFGDSFLGEVWFAEAPVPEGPWEYAIKVATHDGPAGEYAFYNPKMHPFFNQQNDQIIFFEGTYSVNFFGNADPTPNYEYNNVMYRLDLATIPSLITPALPGDYNNDGTVNAADYAAWRDTLGETVAPGTGADGDRDGTIGPGDYDVWRNQFGTGVESDASALPEPGSYLLALYSLAFCHRLTRCNKLTSASDA